MNLNKVKMVKEHDTHYEMHDGKAPFRIPKNGLSEKLHGEIRKMADGGAVLSVDDLHSDSPAAISAAVAPPESMQRPYALSIPGPVENSPVDPQQLARKPEDPELRQLLNAPEPELHRAEEDPFEKLMKGDTDRRMAEKTSADQLGIRKRGEAKTDEAPVATPAPAPLPHRAGIGGAAGPLPGVTDETNAVAEERAAIEKKGQLEAETAKQTAAALAEGDKVLQAHELAQKEMQTRARMTAEDLMRKHEAATTDLQNQDMSVDPGRFWASRSTAGKISGILGLALGALGTGPDGINRAASMLTASIDRDIDAQKAEHGFRLQKGKASIDAAQSMYAMNHQIFQNDLAADAAAHATAWARVDNNLKRILAGGAGPQAQAAAAQLSAISLEKQAKFKSDAANIAFDNQTQRILANASAGAKGGTGLSTPEQSKVFDVKTATQNIRDNIAKAKDIISRKGTFELTGTEQTELERALHFAAQDTARLADPGSTVKDAELENAKKAIGVAGGEIFTLRNATAIKLLDSFEAGIEQRQKRALEVRGMTPDSTADQIERKGKK